MATGIPKSTIAGSLENQNDAPIGGQIHLSYEGKRSVPEIIANCPKAKLSLAESSQYSQGWTNRLYFGDNFPILGTLLDDSAIRGQVSLIYIDPPYSTNSVFESRQQKVAYHDLISGAAFIESLREKLVLLRELLSDRGSIYVHLDENMAFPMKIVMDEVFGAGTSGTLSPGKSATQKTTRGELTGTFPTTSCFTQRPKPISGIALWLPGPKTRRKRNILTWSRQRAEDSKRCRCHAPGVRHGETGKPWRGMPPPPGKHWQFPPSTLEEMDRRGEIFWSSNGNPRRKIYLEDSDGIPVQDIWLDFKDAHNQNIEITGYPTEKNMEMLEQIISASSEPGDLVLDCFAGSGTTLVAAGNLGRRWIGIDNSEEAISAIVNRLRFGSRPMGDYVTKKRAPAAELHLELFGSNTEFEQKAATNGATEIFCLYRITDESDFISQSNVILTLKDQPAAHEIQKHLQKVVYKAARKHSLRKKNTR